MIKILCIFLVYSLSMGTSIGQISQTARLEFEKKDRFSEDYEVVPFGQNGLILIKKEFEYLSKNNKWEFSNYSENLQEKWKIEYETPRKQFPLLHYQNTEFLYWLFAEPDEKTAITILKIDILSGEYEEIKGDLLAVNELSHFQVLGTKAFFAGKFQSKPVVALFNFFDGGNKVLPNLFLKPTEILVDMKVDNQKKTIIVSTHTQSLKTDCEFSVFEFSNEGKLLNNLNLPISDHKNLLTAQVIKNDKNENLIIGNYGNECNNLSVGLFAGKESTNPNFSFYDFNAFNHFFDYLGPKKSEKVQEKIEKKKGTGKEPKLKQNLLIHELKVTKNAIWLVAENYFTNFVNPTINNSVYQNGSIFSKRNERNIENFKFTNAIICKFDLNGKLIWDNSFAMKDLESEQLFSKIEFNEINNQLLVAYSDNGKISTLKLDENGKEISRQIYEAKDYLGLQKLKWTEDALLFEWYNQHFLFTGYQSISTNDNPNGKNREVFFISKLSF